MAPSHPLKERRGNKTLRTEAGNQLELAREGRRGFVVFGLALIPVVTALGCIPWFVTQDGPAHLYNAQILVESARGGSPFEGTYTVAWRPLPNWLGHLSLMGLLGMVPPPVADRLVMLGTLVGFSGILVWLRLRVAGPRGLAIVALSAVILGLNVTWLLGFSSFLIGSSVALLTLGFWWLGRERPTAGWAFGMAGFLVLGYFAHLISLALTVLGLLTLALTTPGENWRSRLVWTLSAFLPLGPLALVYRGLTTEAGAFQPSWGYLAEPWAWRSWFAQLGWVDPITLGRKTALPFWEGGDSIGFALLTPALWFGIGFLLLISVPIPSHRRGWAWLGALLILLGVFGPDRFGPDHGDYLGQRVVLLGLAALVPAWEVDWTRLRVRIAAAAFLLAVGMQSAFVWDYALESNRKVGTLLEARPFVGQGQRVGTLLIGIKGNFRSNPLLHADCLLGIDSGNVIWSNYETRHYYFPVAVRADLDHPSAWAFEEVAMLDGPGEEVERARRWAELLKAHAGSIDLLVIWGQDDRLDAINAHWFEPVVERAEGQVRVCRRR